VKKRSLAILVVIAVLVVGLGYLAAFGATFGYYDILSIDRAISQGLELAGGTCAVYQVKTGETSENLKEDLQKEQMMIAERLSGMGYSDATVVTQGENQIRIELPEMIDTAKILNTVTKKAQLQFIDEADKVWLTGEHVERAFAGYYNLELGQVSMSEAELFGSEAGAIISAPLSDESGNTVNFGLSIDEGIGFCFIGAIHDTDRIQEGV